MGIQLYTVISGENLPNLALRLLGDANQWTALARFNTLRYPYISDDPLDQLGVPNATGALGYTLLAGQTSLTLTPPPVSSLVDVGGTVAVTYRDSTGVQQLLTGSVRAYRSDTGLVTLALPVAASAPPDARWSVYAVEQPTRVLKTGDTLLVPTPDNLQLGAQDARVDFLGTDIYMQDDGFLLWDYTVTATGVVTLTTSGYSAQPLLIPAGAAVQNPQTHIPYLTIGEAAIPAGSGTRSVTLPVQCGIAGAVGSTAAHTITAFVPGSIDPQVQSQIESIDNPADFVGVDGVGDVATVTGVPNVRQAVRNRLLTRPGELPYQATYGNPALTYIGIANQALEAALVGAEILKAVGMDDRIAAVTAPNIHRDTADLFVNLDVKVAGSAAKLTLRDIQLTLFNRLPASPSPFDLGGNAFVPAASDTALILNHGILIASPTVRVSASVAPTFINRLRIAAVRTPSFTVHFQTVQQSAAPSFAVDARVHALAAPSFNTDTRIRRATTPAFAVTTRITRAAAPAFTVVTRVRSTAAPTFNILA